MNRRPPPTSLSVIVPVFNERGTLRELLDQLVAKRIPGMAIQFLIVESNSTDGSREIVLEYRGRPGVEVILEEKPRGKGRAVRTGLAAATGDIIMIQDADLEYDLNDYEVLLAPIIAGRQTFVLGARHGVELPITSQIGELLAGRKDARTALYDLMLRPQRAEIGE